MKIAVVLCFVAFAAATDYSEFNTAYGYMEKIGIPTAERILAQETEYLRNPVSRIFNGSPASLGQFAYQAGLLSNILGSGGRGACGGVLISENRVLTAAHCWFDGQNQAWRFEVVLGSVTLFFGGTRVFSSDVVVHSNWVPSLIRNDIAIIRLPSPVTLSSNIGLVALPSGDLVNEDFVGEEATASGYGMIGNTQPITTFQTLSYGKGSVISNDDCRRSFFIVQPSNLCLGTQGASSPCRGDSGGPLVVERDGARVLVGLTSFGAHPDVGGCEVGLPAVFVRVSSYVDFIQENL